MMLKTIKDIIQKVSLTEHFEDAVHTIVTQVKQAVKADVCSCYVFNEIDNSLSLTATEGLNQSAVGFTLPISKGLVGLVASREEPLNLEDAFEHEAFCYIPETGEKEFHAFLGVPIIHAGNVLGVLVVQQKEKRRFRESEEAFLVTISAQLAGVLAHARITGFLEQVADSKTKPKTDLMFHGIAGGTGVAIGDAVVVTPVADFKMVVEKKIKATDKETRRFLKAVNAAKKDLKRLSERMGRLLPAEEHALFTAYIQILQGEGLTNEVIKEIESGFWAPSALKRVIERYISSFESMDDAYLRERAIDIRDLGSRVLAYLQHTHKRHIKYPEQTILVGEEITASELAEVPAEKLAGIVSLKGSANSHVAILARAMDIPIVLGIDSLPIKQLTDKTMIVNGYNGDVYVAPSAHLLEQYQTFRDEENQLRSELDQIKDLTAETIDGFAIPLQINAGLIDDLGNIFKAGAEGVGLYRTEIPFMTEDRFPSETKQTKIYQEILKAYHPNPVVMRTLDIGGDKPLPYFPMSEDNPFLGWRGIRVSLDHPELFLIQVRAMLKANAGLNNLSIMLPMITELAEIDEAYAFIQRAHQEVTQEGITTQMPRIGAMIEVPSACLMAKSIAKKVDFLSVGSNDLTQYLLAVDRNNPRVAHRYDSLHPAVLKALKMLIDSAHEVNKPVSVCGEMASDPVGAVLLIAMGYDSLSMNAISLPRIKWVIRNFTMETAQLLLQSALKMDDTKSIRNLVTKSLTEAGLGGLVRAGKH